MTVIILEKVPTRLRGELSRWLIEPRAGVFVGTVSALVRDKLWEKVCEACGKTRGQGRKPGALLLCRARTEQGFAIRSYGDPSRTPVDFEGLTLIRTPPRPEKDENTGNAASPALEDEPDEPATHRSDLLLSDPFANEQG